MSSGYLKLYRKMADWEWYHDVTTKVLFIHLLITSSYIPYKYCGKEIPAGARACTLRKLGEECGLTLQQVRTSIEHLKHSGEIDVTAHSHFTVIKLNKWDEYQAESEPEKPKKQSRKKKVVPEIHRDRFGDDYDAYIKWFKERTGES